MARSLNYFAIFLALAALLGLCEAQANQTCAPGVVTPISNFYTEKFLGTWHFWKYVVRTPEDVYPLDYSCLDIEVVEDDSDPAFPLILNEKYVNLTTGNRSQIKSYVTPDVNLAVWKVVDYDFGSTREHKIVNVQTDYENWAIQYACSILGNIRYEDMSILTRSRTPSKELISVLDSLINNFGFSPENSMPVDHSNC